MDLTPLQRKLVFAVIVVALAGLGVFLLRPGFPAGTPRPALGGSSGAPASSPRPASPTPASPAPGPQPSAVNIYQWLPFTQADLAAAAGVVRQFCTDYATYSYRDSAASYTGRMGRLVTPSLAATLARGYAAPGVAQLRAQQKQSATGSGGITALRAFGTSSLTFLVTVVQRTYRGQGAASVASTGYAVTVVRAASGWQVNDVQLASAGNT